METTSKMTLEEKKAKIKAMVLFMLEESQREMEKKIDRALNSGALDLDSWSREHEPMIIPKVVVITLLENEADQYKATGTSFEKKVKREVKNLKHFV